MIKYIFIFKKSKTILTFLAIISIFASIIGIATTYFNGFFIDTLIISTEVSQIINLSIYLLGISLLGLLLRFFVGYIYAPLKEKIVYDLKKHVMKNVKKESLKNDYNYLSKRIDEDSRQFIGFVLENYSVVIIKIIELVILSILIFRINFHIGLLSLVICPIYFFLYKIFKSSIFNKSLDVREGSSVFFKDYTNQFSDNNNVDNINNSFN